MVASSIPLEGRAFLNALAIGESGPTPDYTILYGGGHFATAPAWTFPTWAGNDNSHAAGRYQFEPATWQTVSAAAGLKDFSPDNQDMGAWWLAKYDYNRRSGRDLLSDLRSGVLENVATVLQPTWTSLNASTFPGRYSEALKQEMALAAIAMPPKPPPVSVASVAPPTPPTKGTTMLAYIGQRMQEASSFAGLAAGILGAAHIANAQTLAQSIIGVVVAIGGLIAVLVQEGKPAA